MRVDDNSNTIVHLSLGFSSSSDHGKSLPETDRLRSSLAIQPPPSHPAQHPTTTGTKPKTPIPGHATTPMAMVMSESADATDSTSMLQLCVEGYVNTPELSAGRGGGLSQDLPANGPYKSVFRAGSRSSLESRASASNHHKATAAPASSLHVVAEAAQSPEALSPVSATASPQPIPATPVPAPTSVPTSMKRSRVSSPLIASTSPVPPLAPLDLISAVITGCVVIVTITRHH